MRAHHRVDRYALSYSNGDANVGQIGLAITVH